MNQHDEKLFKLLLDEREISRLLIRFSRCIDTKNFEKYAELYAADGELRTPWGGHSGREGLAEHVRRDLGKYEGLHHVSAGHSIDVDGDTAQVRATLLATHVTNDTGTEFWSVGGHYDINLKRIDGAWKLRVVEIHPTWRFDTSPTTEQEESQ
ncbi:conserved hypothetical protein [Arthrobacter sp. 9AX]|uniref:nuclear transport factor 2 family protein n=1 Tax=Arthrobacter sp. 9AX TaxID=2653131 RepID=UPI0012F01E29|nr:nuclear transport factor 2 family protein [Arthrobacter sp. 9AX]VXC24592.1 conserved hypothetical protein [Arthrobacter sp. 9AX]